MINDILTLALAVTGAAAILYYILYKLIMWREEPLTVAVPLTRNSRGIEERVSTLRSFAEMTGINKKFFVVIIDYGAEKERRNELEDKYGDCDYVSIIDGNNDNKKLAEILQNNSLTAKGNDFKL